MEIQKFNKKFKTEEKTIKYLIKKGILPLKKVCWRCKREMKFYITAKQFICNKKNCGLKFSILKYTFFEGSKLPLNKILYICYLYLISESSVSGIKRSLGCSSKTVSEWLEYLRQLVGESMSESEIQIGGPGIIVEIDETKMGRRKYHRGHKVEGAWVVAGVERTPEKRMFAITVLKRDEETLYLILKKYVKEGSIVYTDQWKAYNQACQRNDFFHYTVNHSKWFKDPNAGVHTNTIEGQNNALKFVIKPRNRNKKQIKNYLLYFLWRRINKKNLWKGFLKALKEIRYK